MGNQVRSLIINVEAAIQRALEDENQDEGYNLTGYSLGCGCCGLCCITASKRRNKPMIKSSVGIRHAPCYCLDTFGCPAKQVAVGMHIQMQVDGGKQAE